MEENIAKPDLYVFETSSPISDQFISTRSSGEQPSLLVVHLSSSTAFFEKVIYMWNKTDYISFEKLEKSV